jgi:hypothetical protein
MPNGKTSRALGIALLALNLGTAAHGADADQSCPFGAEVMRELRQSDCDWQPITQPAGDSAISQFEQVARDNGLAAGLRTFARTHDFLLYGVEAGPMALGAADKYLDGHDVLGVWIDAARGRSADSSLLFSAGEVLLPKGRRVKYVQVWQFDPKTANWGVRLLMIGATLSEK